MPCSKMLMDEVPPVLASALLYLGAGMGMAVFLAARRKLDLPVPPVEAVVSTWLDGRREEGGFMRAKWDDKRDFPMPKTARTAGYAGN